MKSLAMLKTIIIYFIFAVASFATDWLPQEEFGKGGSGGVAWGDYNNDGWEDVAMVCHHHLTGFITQVDIFKNLGPNNENFLVEWPPNISFSKVHSLSGGKLTPKAVCWGDIDNDQDLDLITTGAPPLPSWPPSPQPETVEIWLNDGAPNYTFTNVIKLGDGETDCGKSIALSDYDCDGFLDILIANHSGPSRLFHNNTDGTFAESFQFPSNANSAAWSDVNGDFKPDFALATDDGVYIVRQSRNPWNNKITFNFDKINGIENYQANCLCWCYFQNQPTLFVGGEKNDKTGDCHVKAVTFNFLGIASTAENLFADGKYFKDKTVAITTALYTQSDNFYPELFIADSTSVSRVLYSSVSNTHRGSAEIATVSATGMAHGDFNRDGFIDIAINTLTNNSNLILTQVPSNNEDQPFPTIQICGKRNSQGNGNDYCSIVSVKTSMGDEPDYFHHEISAGMGAGSQNSPKLNFRYWGDYHFILPDKNTVLDTSNIPEMELLTDQNFYFAEFPHVKIYEDKKIDFNPGYLALQELLPGYRYRTYLGDINNDGYIDIVATQWQDNNGYVLKVFLNGGRDNKQMYYESQYDYQINGTPSDIKLCDIDNDEDLDIILAIDNSNNVLLRNLYPNLAFDAFDKFGVRGRNIAIADLDTDGALDVIIHHYVGGTKWYHNQWNSGQSGTEPPNFMEHELHPNTDFAGSLCVVDFDRDFDMDILSPYGFYRNNMQATNDAPTSFTYCDPFVSWQEAQWCDYDLDEYPDLFTHGKKYKNNYNPDFPDNINFTSQTLDLGHYTAFSDFNLDGFLDVFSSKGLFVNTGRSPEFSEYFSFTNYKPFYTLTRNPIQLFDLDRDGDFDFTSIGRIFENTRGERGNITVQMDGASTYDSNCDGLGAWVRLYVANTDSLVGNQQVQSSSSYAPGEVSFGVSTEKTYDIEIIFLGGRSTYIQDIQPLGDEATIVKLRNTTDIDSDDQKSGQKPATFSLYQNYPNPFNPNTQITFKVPKTAQISIDIYNLNGQLVEKLFDEKLEIGLHSITWDASSNPTGMYIIRMQADDFVSTKKCLLLK